MLPRIEFKEESIAVDPESELNASMVNKANTESKNGNTETKRKHRLLLDMSSSRLI